MLFWILKVLVVGAAGVGKTTFLNYMRANSRFFIDYSDSIGVNFSVSEIFINNDIRCKFQFWDVKADARFRSFLFNFCRGASGCLLFFDTSNYESFVDLSYWIKFVRKNAGDIPIVLIGTKTDLSYEVNFEEILDLVGKYGLEGYYLTSVRLGFKKEIIYEHLAKKIINFSHISPELLFSGNLQQSLELTYDERKARLSHFLGNICKHNKRKELNSQDLHTPSESTTLFRTFKAISEPNDYMRFQNFSLEISNPCINQENNRENQSMGLSGHRNEMLGELRQTREIMRRSVENENTQEEPMGGLRSLRDEMLEELERLRNIMRDYDIEEDEKYINLSDEEREIFDNFLEFFATCPVCRSENHKSYLRNFYFDSDQDKVRLKERLLNFIYETNDSEDIYYNKITLGIPCCDCFKKFF